MSRDNNSNVLIVRIKCSIFLTIHNESNGTKSIGNFLSSSINSIETRANLLIRSEMPQAEVAVAAEKLALSARSTSVSR